MSSFFHTYSALDGKIAYYRGLKVGSSTILTWINLINNPELRLTHPDLYDTKHWYYNEETSQALHKNKDEIRKKDLIFLPKEPYEAPGGQKFLLPVVPPNNEVRFCIVRDPVERFISGYANRVCKESIMSNVSISDFINNIDYYFWKYQNIESHFSPMIFTYGQDPSIYTNIYNIKQMPEIKKMLESYSGPLPDLTVNRTRPTVKSSISLTDAQINYIKRRYAIDYEVYGEWL